MDYSKSRWRKKREYILKKDRHVDQYLKRYGIMREANTVHHIYPAEAYPEYAYSDWNLISVSQSTHNKLENRNTGELTTAGEELKRNTVPGKKWRTR